MSYPIYPASFPAMNVSRAGEKYGKDLQPCCTAFVPAGQTIPEPRCTLTKELF